MTAKYHAPASMATDMHYAVRGGVMDVHCLTFGISDSQVRELQAGLGDLPIKLRMARLPQLPILLKSAICPGVLIADDDPQEIEDAVRGVRESPSCNHNATVFVLSNDAGRVARSMADFVLPAPFAAPLVGRAFKTAYPIFLRHLCRTHRELVSVPAALVLADGLHMKATIIDISEGGIGFNCRPMVDVGRIVSLRFVLPGTSDHVDLRGIVLWNRPNGMTGMKFLTPVRLISEAFQHWLETHTAVAEAWQLVNGLTRVSLTMPATPVQAPRALVAALGR